MVLNQCNLCSLVWEFSIRHTISREHVALSNSVIVFLYAVCCMAHKGFHCLYLVHIRCLLCFIFPSNIKAVPVGMSRGVKKLIKARIPDMGKYDDVSELLLRYMFWNHVHMYMYTSQRFINMGRVVHCSENTSPDQAEILCVDSFNLTSTSYNKINL